MSDDYGDLSLFGLFAQETEAQAALLGNGLITLERTPEDASTLESCMRAAHSLKGAARIVGVAPGVAIAHVMEECFVQAQRHDIRLEPSDIDLLLRGVDLLRDIALAGEGAAAPTTMAEVIAALEQVCAGEHPGTHAAAPVVVPPNGPIRLDDDRDNRHDSFPDAAPPFPAFDFPRAVEGDDARADGADTEVAIAQAPPAFPAMTPVVDEASHGVSAVAKSDASLADAAFEGLFGAGPSPIAGDVVDDVQDAGTASVTSTAAVPTDDVAADDTTIMPDAAAQTDARGHGGSDDMASPLSESSGDGDAPVVEAATPPAVPSVSAIVEAVSNTISESIASGLPAAPATPAARPAAPPPTISAVAATADISVIAAPPAPPVVTATPAAASAPTSAQPPTGERTLRVAARNLDRLLALSGQAVVEARTFRPLIASMLSLMQRQRETILSMQSLRNRLIDAQIDEVAMASFEETSRLVDNIFDETAARLSVIEQVEQRHYGLSNQLYEAALASRMRPFADITGGYARMVREVARGLGKQVKLTIVGETVPVDRDILALLDAPLGHLLRNAVDHGIESPMVRQRAGKTEEGEIRIDARHVAGTLVIDIVDDGGGVDIEAVRARVVRRGLVNPSVAPRLSEAELLEFLMLPGFSMRETVSDVSGRGVGLDVVQTTVRQVRGNMRITQTAGVGTRFQLQLPLTLSVMRCLVAEIGAEPYAFPLAHIVRAMRVEAVAVETVEGRPHFTLDGQSIALVLASQVLRCAPPPAGDGSMQVIVLGSDEERYGLVVDQFREERMLVIQPIDPRLGKITDISAASLMDDGAPVLIVDVSDVLRSMARLASAARVEVVSRVSTDASRAARKRILVVDDSLTVRELQRKLLTNGGYDVSVAVDGMEGWNALMSNRFDMVVTDVDMPRVDGIELVTMIRRDPEFRTLPVMIVSYKDRPADRQRGLDAGADHYLAKSSFHDAALLDAVRDLIGDATG